MAKKKDAWIYYIKTYFDILIELNSTFIKLISLDGKENNDKKEKQYFETFDKISRLIPLYSYYNSKTVNVDNKSGIVELTENNIDFVKQDLDEIVGKYNYELFNIKSLRNEAEHSPHLILSTTYINKNFYSSITLNYKKRCMQDREVNLNNIDCYYCNVEILLNIIMDLNKLFYKLQKIVKTYCDKNKCEDIYFKRCLEIKFIWYNQLYKNKNFLKICKISG